MGTIRIGECEFSKVQVGDANQNNKPFHLSCTMVTVRQYLQYANEIGLTMSMNKIVDTHDYPLIGISWEEAMGYCRWFGGKVGFVCRLPSEGEWFLAATDIGKQRYFGTSDEEEINRYSWSLSNSGGEIHVVAALASHGLGLFDMTGNAWEWCLDFYSGDRQAEEISLSTPPFYRKLSSSLESLNLPRKGRFHSIRGGSFNSPSHQCDPRTRFYGDIGFRDYYIGFRLLLEA